MHVPHPSEPPDHAPALVIDFDGGPDTARDIVLQRNGKIVVVGDATDRGTRRFGVARIRGS